jgi:hypothetical protein
MTTLSHDEEECEDEMDEEVEEEAHEADDNLITFNGMRVSVEVGWKHCVDSIEKGTGCWKCTNVSKPGASFEIS